MLKKYQVDKNKKHLNKKIYIITAAVLLISVAIAWPVAVGILRTMNVQSQMAQYLKTKYNEDFIVKSPEHKNGGLGVTGIWASTAHPVNNADLEFDMNCSVPDPSDCSDQYIAAMWSIQATEDIKNIADEINKTSEYKVTDIRAEVVLSGDLVDSVNKKSRYEDYNTRDNGILHSIVIDSPYSEEKPVYIFKIVEELRSRGVYHMEVDTNKGLSNKERCSIFFDKQRLRSVSDITLCISQGERG